MRPGVSCFQENRPHTRKLRKLPLSEQADGTAAGSRGVPDGAGASGTRTNLTEERGKAALPAVQLHETESQGQRIQRTGIFNNKL